MGHDTPQGETLKGHAGPLNIEGEGLAGIVSRAVRQATDGESQVDILGDALAQAELDRVPVSAGPLTNFVLGALFDTALAAVGRVPAERIVKILKPILAKRSELELGSAPPASLYKKTVLIVDQDIMVRAKLLSILTSAGYEALSAPDGNVALAMSVRCRPDLVISELNTGSVGGSQLATFLRVAFTSDAPPLIILTNDTSWSETSIGVCTLPKPIERVALLSAVRPLIGDQPSETAVG